MTGARLPRLSLPVYYQHPGTGVIVEVDEDSVVTIEGGNRYGEARPFSRMKKPGWLKSEWGPADEINVLRKARWKAL